MKQERVINILLRYVAASNEEERSKAVQDARTALATSEPLAEDLPLDRRIENQLVEIGVPANQLGFQYIVDAVMLWRDDKEYLSKITTRLYPTIAAKHGRSKGCVERSIRLSIETAFDRGDLNVLNKMFGNTISASKGRPTNGEFLSRLVMEFR